MTEDKQPVTVSDHVLEQADIAFWAAVVAAFPDVTSGDFPPDLTHLVTEQKRAAVNYWLKLNHPANSDALWVREFGAEYAVPAVVEDALPDMSWHNDACPSFGYYTSTPDSERAVRLWVEHPDATKRETGEASKRYAVIVYGDNGDTFTGHEGDDVTEALRVVAILRRLLGFVGDEGRQ